MGGGVGGLLYAENADSSGLNYKHYNLRGDIVATTDSGGSILSELRYLGNGDIKGSSGTQPADKFKHNTKRVEDGFVNEGRRYRDIEMMRFTSPDPLEYIDGLNCYAYCGNNPWGRFDPYGLADTYLADGAGAAYASYDNYKNEFIVATMMKFYIRNIKNIEAGKKYIFVREVNININSEKQKIVVANDFVGTKNTELDLRVFLSDIYNNYVLNSDTGDENTIVANVRFAIIEGSADKLGMPKSNVSVVDMNQSGEPIGDVKKYKSTQKGKLAFYAEDSGKLTSYAAENMTLDDIIKGHNVQDSGSFSYKNKIRITDKSFGTGENEVSGSGILDELIKIPKNTYYEINKNRNNIYKNNITGKQ